MERYVGLDVHSKCSVFALQDASGLLLAQGKVPSTPEGLQQIRDRHELAPGTPVALEAGTNAFFVVDVLQELGLAPVVIEASEVRAKASRPLQKSDSRDALELCEGLRRGIYRSRVWVPPPQVRLARELLSRRRHFVRLKTAQINAAKRLLRGTGRGPLSRSLTTATGWKRLMESLERVGELQEMIGWHQAVWLAADEQVRKVETKFAAGTASWEAELGLLMTVPGVGRIVAGTFLAVVGDVRRFPDAKRLASYAGLVPSTFQSGNRDRHGHITHRGSAELRAMLCEAAQQARRVSNPLNPYFTRVRSRHGYRMAIVAVAHRLCRMLYAVLRDGTTFDLVKAGVEEGSFTWVSVRRYRQTTVNA